jgi:hypothetical protein
VSVLDIEFAKENSELCIRIAQQEKELAKLCDLLARLLCWPLWDDLREGPVWKREITETLRECAATLSDTSKEQA